LFEKAKEEDKEKYDFGNYFRNTFFLSDEEIEIYEKKSDFNKDDEIIQTFKIAKLL